MTAKDWSREIAAVSPFIRGASVEVRGAAAQPIPGVGKMVDPAVTGLASLGDASVDTLISICGLELEKDAIATVRQYRRVLLDGGNLVLVVRTHTAPEATNAGENRYSPQYLTGLLTLVGGFEVAKVEEVVVGESFLVVCVRSAIAEVRHPFGIHGPAIIQRVNATEAARAEYYFQIGTMMLQTGDADFAVTCFEHVLAVEPDNPDACFGLGMTLGTKGRWQDALACLSRAAALDPANEEVSRWLQLAQDQIQKAAAVQTATPTVGIPQVAPTAGGIRSPSQVTPAPAPVVQARSASGPPTPGAAMPAGVPPAGGLRI